MPTSVSQRCALQEVNGRLRGATVSVGALRRRAPSLTWRAAEAYVQAALF